MGWQDAPPVQQQGQPAAPGWRGAPKAGAPGPAKPPPTPWWASALTGAADMITLGGLDELAAGAASVFKGVPYREALPQVRQRKEAAFADNPGTALAGGLGGAALTLPFQPWMRAGSMAGQVGGGLASGALFGGLYGFNEGQGDDTASGVQNRLENAGMGALTGGTFGAMAPFAVPLLLRPAARGVGNVATAASRLIPGTLSKRATQSQAARRVAGALARDDQAKSFAPIRSPRDTLQSRVPMMEDAAQQGRPTILADTGDEWTRALLRSATNTSPEGRGIVQTVLGDRFASQAERARQFAANLFGTRGDNAARIESLQRSARIANKPLYDAAERAGSGGIWTDEIARLTGAPEIQAAMRTAVPRARTESVIRGMDPGSVPASPFVEIDGMLVPRLNPDGSRAIPNLAFWDQVQRNLSQRVNVAKRAGRTEDATKLGELHRQLLAELDAVVPEFKQARAGAAAFFGAQDAVEAGQMAARDFRNLTNEQIERGLRQMSIPERDLFKEGMANDIIQQLDLVRNGRNITNSVWWNTPQGKERVALVFGRRQADEWEAYGRLENTYNLTRSALGNSQTARYLFELGLAGGGAYALGGGFNPLDPGSYSASHILGGLLAIGARRGMGRISEKTSREVARLLATGSAEDVARAAKIVSGNPALMVAVRNAEDMIRAAVPRAGVQQTDPSQLRPPR